MPEHYHPDDLNGAFEHVPFDHLIEYQRPCPYVDRCDRDDHVVVLNQHEYDDLVRRAAAHDIAVNAADAQQRAYLAAVYAAFADNGYVGTLHPDGSVTWEVRRADAAGPADPR